MGCVMRLFGCRRKFFPFSIEMTPPCLSECPSFLSRVDYDTPSWAGRYPPRTRQQTGADKTCIPAKRWARANEIRRLAPDCDPPTKHVTEALAGSFSDVEQRICLLSSSIDCLTVDRGLIDANYCLLSVYLTVVIVRSNTLTLFGKLVWALCGAANPSSLRDISPVG